MIAKPGCLQRATTAAKEKPRRTGRVEMNGGSGFCRGLLFWASEERGFDADGAEHVIGENRKRHFGCSSFEVSGEEPAATHHPLDRAERILGGTATPAHHLGAGALVHPVERILVKVAGTIYVIPPHSRINSTAKVTSCRVRRDHASAPIPCPDHAVASNERSGSIRFNMLNAAMPWPFGGNS